MQAEALKAQREEEREHALAATINLSPFNTAAVRAHDMSLRHCNVQFTSQESNGVSGTIVGTSFVFLLRYVNTFRMAGLPM